jgi:phage tail-like protein
VAVPAPARNRALLRGSLPAVYQDAGSFGMRFLEGLETLLDPVVAVLDSLPAYFEPRLAPPDMVALMAAWLGVELDEDWSLDHRSAVVATGPAASWRRPTRQGLEHELRLAFPDLALGVEESGTTVWAQRPEDLPPPRTPEVVVLSDRPVPSEQQEAVARWVRRSRPAHVAFRLRLQAP